MTSNDQLNRNYHDLVREILTSMGEWDFGGEIATASLVADQREYTWPTDILKIKRVEVTYDGTNWYKAGPIDTKEDDETLSLDADVNNRYQTNDPKYDAFDQSFFLFPVPTVNSSNGIKIWYIKDVTDLSADADEPVIAEPFQHLIAVGAAYDFAMRKGLPIVKQLKSDMDNGIEGLRAYYNTRVPDRNIAFGVNHANYK